MHERIAMTSGGRELADWTRYEIVSDMLAWADDFVIAVAPPSLEVWQLAAPGSAVTITVDGTTILTGFIDSRALSGDASGASIAITGRDKGGRLVDESMPVQKLLGLDLAGLGLAVAGEWFSRVELSNAENRALVRGRGTKAPAGAEPVFARRADAPRLVEPGERRVDVLEHYLPRARVLAWSTADGEALVIGRPNRTQAPQYCFHNAGPQANVVRYELVENLAEMYSEIAVVGAQVGSARHRRGVARDGAGPAGTGGYFLAPKRLVVASHDITSAEHAQELADRELMRRRAGVHALSLTVQGHGQVYERGAEATLYAFDTVADVCIREGDLVIEGHYLITRVMFRGDPEQGPITELSLVPNDIDLTA